MQRSLSSRMVVSFKNGKLTNISLLTKPENRYLPIKKVVEDEKILKGFIWMPKDRPVSKEAIIPSHRKTTDKGTAAKPPVKKQPGTLPKGKPAIDNLKSRPVAGRDSSVKTDTVKRGDIKTLKDSVIKAPPAKPQQPQKMIKDTTKGLPKIPPPQN